MELVEAPKHRGCMGSGLGGLLEKLVHRGCRGMGGGRRLVESMETRVDGGLMGLVAGSEEMGGRVASSESSPKSSSKSSIILVPRLPIAVRNLGAHSVLFPSLGKQILYA